MNSNDGRDTPIHIVPPRAVSESQSQMAEVVLPNDANPLGNLLGGRLMHLIDIAGALAAHRHSHSHVVTASIDHIDFRRPVHIGDLLILKRHFDVFSNPNTDTVVRALDPEAVVVYGLPLEICVRHVVEGWLARRPHTRLFVVTDAVKAVRYEMGEHALRDWGDEGVRLVKAEEIVSEGTLGTWLEPA